jgi:hypothetical protein
MAAVSLNKCNRDTYCSKPSESPTKAIVIDFMVVDSISKIAKVHLVPRRSQDALGRLWLTTVRWIRTTLLLHVKPWAHCAIVRRHVRRSRKSCSFPFPKTNLVPCARSPSFVSSFFNNDSTTTDRRFWCCSSSIYVTLLLIYDDLFVDASNASNTATTTKPQRYDDHENGETRP